MNDVERAVYLLGAGASKEAGIPLASEMTAAALERMSQQQWRRHGEILNHVVGEIVASRARRGTRPDHLPDIETVVSAVELLASREDLEVAPFVSWNPEVAVLDRVASKAQPGWEQLLRDGIVGKHNLSPRDGDIAQALRAFIEPHLGSGRLGESQRLQIELVRMLIDMLAAPLDADVTYLLPLVRQGASEPLVVATLNYDRTLELAAAEADVECSTGLGQWTETGRLTWPSQGLRLMKLHGSIDWVRDFEPLNSAELRVPRVTLRVGAPATRNEVPFVVFGRREKLRPEGPFLDLRHAFADALRQSNHLVVVGYSFADDHVNEVITQWLDTDVNRRLTVIDPAFPTTWAAAGEDYRFLLLAGLQRQDGPDVNRVVASRLSVIREPASRGISQLIARPGDADPVMGRAGV